MIKIIECNICGNVFPVTEETVFADCPMCINQINCTIHRKEIKKWNPFDDYKEPCYVEYEGELSIYSPVLSNLPIKVKEIAGIKAG